MRACRSFVKWQSVGFAAVGNPNDPVVEMIVKSNIAGIVGAVNGGAVVLPPTVREGNKAYGLVPTTQSARNLLALVLTYFEKERLEKLRLKKECRKKGRLEEECLDKERLQRERRWGETYLAVEQKINTLD